MYDKLTRIEKVIFDVLSVFLVLFYSYSAVLKPQATQYHRGIYIIITYILVFLLYKSRHKLLRIVDYLLILLSIFSIGYWMMYFEVINYRTGAETPFDMGVAIIGVLIGIELARRVVGSVFVILGVLLLLYGVYGDYMPDLISHAGDTFPGVCTSIFYKSDGVFGIMANVLATYVLLSVLFGAFLEKSGAQRFFIDFPLAAVGHKIGGPAKVSVIASGLFGSISGSAIANTVSTVAFPIPMMKKPASGPILRVPSNPLMYVFSVFQMVHFEAKIHNIKGEKSEHSPMEILKREWYYTLPLIVITILMLAGFSPGYSAILGMVTCLIISWFKKDTRITPKRFVEGARAGAENSLKIGATVGVIGIIIGVLTFSGLVLTFADIVIELAGGSLVLTILLIALASLVLGMGVPVTAAYLITAVVAVPALVHLGVNEVAAHMIVYWLSQDSNITPPVCIAAFAGATIAKANMWKTAFSSFKFAKFLYMSPFLFGYVPGYSLQGGSMAIIKAFVLIIIGTYIYSYIMSFHWGHYINQKYFNKVEAV
jgi:TRAP-type uncharacterized transport system fused permease subunit